MSLLPRRFARKRADTEALEERVTALQSALAHCRSVASSCRTWGRELLAVTAVVCLALGFTAGIYRDPIKAAIVGISPWRPADASAQADAAQAAYQKGSYAAALKTALPLAEAGNAKAQSLVGVIHYRGRGVARNDTEAIKWFRQAAEQNDVNAQFYLGVMYDAGHGVPQDGEEATKWYRLAAERGDAQSQYNLGLVFARGETGAQDNVAAHMWFNLAASRFPASNVTGRNAAASNRELIASRMSLEELETAQRLAREWQPK
jgi:uncharacterized protein